MSDQAVTSTPDPSANSGAFVKAFLPGLIIGLVLGGLAGAFFGGFAADSGGPAAAIERSKAEATRMGAPTISAPPAPSHPAEQPKPEDKASEPSTAPTSTPAPAPAKPEEKPR